MREEHIENAFRLEEYDPGDAVQVGDVELRFQPVPHFLPDPCGRVSRAPTAALTYSADSLPERRPVRLRARHRPAADRGHAAAARARRPARASDARGGRRARPPRRRAARRPHPHLRRARRRLGARRRPSAASAARSSWPPRAPSTRSELQSGPVSADVSRSSEPCRPATLDGVRLLSHRPSVLYKVEHLATEPVEGDIAVEGLVLAGPGWNDRLKELLNTVSTAERACLFALRLADEQALPLPAEQLLDRSRTDWFPEFLSHGQMKPALPADRRAGHRPRLRPRGADARQARRHRGPRRRAARRRRGARRPVLLRLPRPHRRAGGRPAAAPRGRGAVRQPRPARRRSTSSRPSAPPGRSSRG